MAFIRSLRGIRIRSFLFAAVVLVFLPASAKAASSVASIDIAHGRVTVARQGVLEPFAARAGSDIYIGDTVATGDGAAVRLSFRDNSFVSMSGNAALRINQYVFESDKYAPDMKRVLIIIRLLRGRARFVTIGGRDVDRQIAVETDTASVSASAADFAVTADTGETRVAALVGVLTIKNISNTVVSTVDLYLNQKTVVREKEPPDKPVYMTPAERRALIRETIIR